MNNLKRQKADSKSKPKSKNRKQHIFRKFG